MDFLSIHELIANKEYFAIFRVSFGCLHVSHFLPIRQIVLPSKLFNSLPIHLFIKVYQRRSHLQVTPTATAIFSSLGKCCTILLYSRTITRRIFYILHSQNNFFTTLVSNLKQLFVVREQFVTTLTYLSKVCYCFIILLCQQICFTTQSISSPFTYSPFSLDLIVR